MTLTEQLSSYTFVVVVTENAYTPWTRSLNPRGSTDSAEGPAMGTDLPTPQAIHPELLGRISAWHSPAPRTLSLTANIFKRQSTRHLHLKITLAAITMKKVVENEKGFFQYM